MFIANCFDTNKEGHLTIGGMDCVELAKKYGTPLYVMDEKTIRDNCKDYVNCINKFYAGKGLPLYASKAFSCKEIYRVVKEEKMGVDVVSGGELYTALSVGFDPSKIFFHGNNKTYDELEYAVESKVGIIVLDNLAELTMLNDICNIKNTTIDAYIRIKPGIDAHTHEFISTGKIDSKFGVALETGEALEMVKKVISSQHVNLKGIHCHIASQVFEVEPFEHAAKVMMSFVKEVKDKTGYEIEGLDLGGGIGVAYTEHEPVMDYDQFMKKVSEVVTSFAFENNLKVPFISVEPGRSIVANAGITLYTIGCVKTIPNIRTYVSVDGGMCDNPRYALYQAEYEFTLANKADKEKDFTATIAGKCCESGDLLQENTKIQNPQVGDILATFATGAYNYSMSSNYNRIPKPAVVFVKDGKDRLVVKRETYQDIVRNDI